MNRLKTVLLLGALTGLFLLIGQALGGRAGATIALFFALATNVGAWWFSDKIVLRMHGAREISPAEGPRLHAMLDELCARAGMPKPRLYLVEDPMPNAFATGRSPKHAAVAVTSGIMRILSEDELRGVLAHELGHVANRDTLISTVAASIAGAISWLGQMAFFFGVPRSDEDEGGSPIGGLALLLLSPIIALILQMAISRSREFQADQTGADWVGSGEPLARALLKLDQASQRIPSATAQPAFSPLYIVHPFTGGGIAKLFSTHPSTEERVKRLMKRSPGIGAFWRPNEV